MTFPRLRCRFDPDILLKQKRCVVELVDTYVLETYAERLVGSTPTMPTIMAV